MSERAIQEFLSVCPLDESGEQALQTLLEAVTMNHAWEGSAQNDSTLDTFVGPGTNETMYMLDPIRKMGPSGSRSQLPPADTLPDHRPLGLARPEVAQQGKYKDLSLGERSGVVERAGAWGQQQLMREAPTIRATTTTGRAEKMIRRGAVRACSATPR